MRRRPRYLPPELRTGSEEQQAVRRVYESVGGIVYSTSDPRMRRADPGVSDLIVLFPARRIALFHESKAGRGELTPDQARFGDYMAEGLITDFRWGDAEVARQFLFALNPRY